ncbi:MAG: hypothetical protein ABR976_08580 [Terracidiphilus sp.]
MSLRARNMVLCAFGLSLLAFPGGLRAVVAGAGQMDGSELSGPPQINIAYHARDPRLCKSLSTPPTPAQLVPVIQCTMEYSAASGIYLVQDVTAAIGAPRSFQQNLDSNLKEVDISSPIYPLSGSLKVYWCSPVSAAYPAGQGCRISPMPEAAGKCWRTTFGDWRCNLTGLTPNSRTGQPGPQTY